MPRSAMFSDLPQLLRPDDLLVFNNTRVMRARLFGRKDTGGRVEILIERVCWMHDEALAQVRASKSPKPGRRIELGPVVRRLVLRGREADLYRLQRSRARPSPHDVDSGSYPFAALYPTTG